MPSSGLQEDIWPSLYRHSVGDEKQRPQVTENVEFYGTAANGYRGCTKELDGRHIELSEDLTTSGKIGGSKQERLVLQDCQKDDCQLTHLFAGGVAGCVASMATCPLDVIKTRQQASGQVQGLMTSSKPYPSKVSRIQPQIAQSSTIFSRHGRMQMTQVMVVKASHLDSVFGNHVKTSVSPSILQHFRHILKTEGPMAFYKGLGPTLVGVVPSRATYFFAYSNAKSFFTKYFNINADASSLHILSAATAGACCTTATSPLWVIKTKLQLHRKKSSMTVHECCSRIFQAEGLRGFYRGMTASYAGILETAIYFAIYERLKLMHTKERAMPCHENAKTCRDYTVLMAIAALSKTTATCVAYPHEVVRTRLREETKKRKYQRFFQTLSLVAKQEGIKALYRGLGTQIVRQVPNMAIVMGTYEFIIDVSSRI